MNPEKHSRTDLPTELPEVQIVEITPEIKETPGVVYDIGQTELDEDNLPGSQPLEENEEKDPKNPTYH